MIELKPIKVKVHKSRYSKEYKLIFIPDYPKSYTSDNWDGWYYEHRYLMELELERFLNSNEDVHHLDGNRGNNRIENLIVLTHGHHQRIHAWIGKDKPYFGENSIIAPECKICSTTLQAQQLSTCSEECENARRMLDSKMPRKDELEQALRTMPLLQIGQLYKVSDNAVRKWCRKYNLPYKKDDIKKYFSVTST